jgi:hypothetical protein
METTTSVCCLQMENGNGKLSFVCLKWKRKTEVCFPWSADDKRYLTIAVSANVPIYGKT